MINRDKTQEGGFRKPFVDDLHYYFRSACSVSAVIFAFRDDKVQVLLQRRDKEPFLGMLSLPAQLVYPNDDIEQKVSELIAESTGANEYYKKQIRAFADASRHPLGRVISIGYYGFVFHGDCALPGNDGEYIWFDLKQIPKLAFDHNEILAAANRRILTKMSTQLTGFELLPKKFTLKQLQALYEAVLGHELDKRNFRRKVMSLGIIQELEECLQPWEGSGKAPLLHTVDLQEYRRLKESGERFEIF